MLGSRLKAQHAVGSRYYVGDALTAVAIYAAAVMVMFDPLPHAPDGRRHTSHLRDTRPRVLD